MESNSQVQCAQQLQHRLYRMESKHLYSAFTFFSMQVVLVLIILNIRGASTGAKCPPSLPTLAKPNHPSSIWYYEHVFDHQPAQLKILTEKDGAAPLRSKIPPKEREITIISQTTRDRLAAVEGTAMTWNGAMSLAVYAVNEAGIPGLYQQLQKLHARVEAHGSCRLDIVVVKEESFDKSSGNAYPVNGMRNIAWRMATTKLIFLLDADFKPSPRMHESLTEDEGVYEELVKKVTQERHLFVVPAFEYMPSNRRSQYSIYSRNNLSIPQTKEDLKQRWEDGNVDCFHCSFSPAGHEPTNFGKWLDPSTTTPYTVSYMEGFEPYMLVGRESTLMYDERFRGYGKNKISQVYACAHGHDIHFQVLPNAFVFEIPHPQSYSRTSYLGGHAKATQNHYRIIGLYRRFRKEVQQMNRERRASAI